MRDRLALAALLLGLPLLLCWPLPLVATTHVLAAADQEAAPHIWGLWAALHTGQPLVIETPLLAWPAGLRVVLVDPANLVFFALGGLFGPAAGYNATLYAGVVLMGIAGVMLARRDCNGLFEGDPFVAAVAGMSTPALLANAADGQTEGFGVGLVGIQLALLLRFLREGGVLRGAAAAIFLALTAWSGPYNGIWAALIDLGVGLSLLTTSEGRQRLGRAAGVALGALPLVLPLAIALQRERAPHLPGNGGEGWSVVENPAIYRGGVQTGADIVDPWLPVQLTGGEAEVSHTIYLGIVALFLAARGTFLAAPGQGRARWPWLLGVAAFTLLSFGPILYLGGKILRVGPVQLVGPVGLLAPVLPTLYRLTRWYRAGAVARILLLPLIASGIGGRKQRWVACALLVLDCLLCAPLAWPLQHKALPDASAYAAMTRDEAVVVLPATTSAGPPPGEWRDREILAQTLHGRPIGASMMGFPPSPEQQAAQRHLQGLMRGGSLRAADRGSMLADGFGYFLLLHRYLPVPDASRDSLSACFGAPLADDKELLIFDLRGGPGGACGPAEQ